MHESDKSSFTLMSICIVIIVAVLGFYWYQTNKTTIKEANKVDTKPKEVVIPNMPQNTGGAQTAPRQYPQSSYPGSTGTPTLGAVTSSGGNLRKTKFSQSGPLGPGGPLGPAGALGPAGPN